MTIIIRKITKKPHNISKFLWKEAQIRVILLLVWDWKECIEMSEKQLELYNTISKLLDSLCEKVMDYIQ